LGRKLHVTASIGVVSTGAELKTVDTPLVRRADSALLIAMRSRRDRVAIEGTISRTPQ
jgi:PleD family two-component response regulator